MHGFPEVDAVLVHMAQVEKTPNLIREVKTLAQKVPIILASPFAMDGLPEVDFVVDSHKPQQLLKLLAEDLQK